MLIRALINQPKLLLLEPWIGLEEQNQQQIKQLLLTEMNRTTVIVITKDETFATACDKTIILKETGCIIINGNPQIPGGGEDL